MKGENYLLQWRCEGFTCLQKCYAICLREFNLFRNLFDLPPPTHTTINHFNVDFRKLEKFDRQQ